jgi:hypothetical protein
MSFGAPRCETDEAFGSQQSWPAEQGMQRRNKMGERKTTAEETPES